MKKIRNIDLHPRKKNCRKAMLSLFNSILKENIFINRHIGNIVENKIYFYTCNFILGSRYIFNGLLNDILNGRKINMFIWLVHILLYELIWKRVILLKNYTFKNPLIKKCITFKEHIFLTLKFWMNV